MLAGGELAPCIHDKHVATEGLTISRDKIPITSVGLNKKEKILKKTRLIKKIGGESIEVVFVFVQYFSVVL